MQPTAPIFISYRRSDAAGHAFALWRELGRRFGNTALFYDRDKRDLPLGLSWDGGLRTAIAGARVCLVVIGPDWLEVRGANGQRRLDDPADTVRCEVAQALARAEEGQGGAMLLIPILFGGASMPLAEQLPADLQGLPARQAAAIQLDLDFDAEFNRLVDALVSHTGLAAQPEAGARRQIWHLPGQKPSAFFADPTGKLPQLAQLLHSQGSAVVLAAVQGMGGVGKTQLALQYIAQQQKNYYGIWWFRAESSALLDQDCAAFCDALGLVVPPGSAHHQALRDRLTQEPRWLLIYDNAEDARALQDYLPDGGPHHVIVTSRQPDWGHAQALCLDVWTDEEALDFLRQRLPLISDAQRRALAHALGGLPLALEQACAYLNKTGASIDAYLAGIADFERQSKLLDRQDSPLASHSVLATLSLAFERLSPAARELLHLCAWLAPEAIPEYLFTEHAELLPSELAARAANELDWRETVAELTGYALCQVAAMEGDGFGVQFHRLAQAAVKAYRREYNEDSFVRAMTLLKDAFPANTGHPDNWSRCAALMPHVLNFSDLHDSGKCPDASRLSWLLDRLGAYLAEARGLYGKTERLQRKALVISQELRGEEHLDTLSHMNNLAETLRALGDLAGSRKLLESVLASRRRLQGEGHVDTLAPMSNLANILKDQGDLASARDLEEVVLASRCRLQGESHQETLTSMNNLAITLVALGDLAGARELQEVVLVESRSQLGEKHPHTINSMSNLAATLFDQRDLGGARELQKAVLAVRQHQLGEAHLDTLIAMNNLAQTLKAQDDLAGARELQESALAVLLRQLGEEHPHTLTFMNNLAETLRAQGDLARARELHQAVLTTRSRVLGEEHSYTLITMSHLANALKAEGALVDARKLEESVLAVRRYQLGEEHLNTIGSAWNLFMTMYQLNDHTADDELLQRHLLPLLQVDPASLSADLREISDWLRKNVSFADETP